MQELQRSVTHILVIPKGSGQKFLCARRWGIPCVLPDWIEECMSTGHVLDPSIFKVESSEGKIVSSTPIRSVSKGMNYY